MRLLTPLAVAASVFLTAVLIPTYPFGSDEGDNILGAMSVLSGGDIYSAFYSQHMPFGYYFTAILALCGAETVPGFRLAYAVFLALLWSWLYWRYARRLPPAMLLFVIAAYPLAAPYFLGHEILADNLAALALLVLLLELMLYRGTGDLDAGLIAVVSAAIFVAVGSCFLSLYPVAAFLAAIFFISAVSSGLAAALKKNLLLAAGIAAPFAVLVAWYAASGNLGNFYYQAYEFNRTVYAKYVQTGYPYEPALKFIILPLAWAQHFLQSLSGAFGKPGLSLDLLLAVANLVFVFLMGRETARAFFCFIFIVYTGTRSYGGFAYTGFHSAPYFVISLAALGWLFARLLEAGDSRRLAAACLVVLFLRTTAPYYARAVLPVYWRHAQSEEPWFRLDGFFATPYDAEIMRITEPGERIWSAGVDKYIFINTGRQPAGRIHGLVPWYAERYWPDIVADLEREKPRVIVFPYDGMVWGQALADFGSNVYSHISAHYRPLDPVAPVRKDIYCLMP